jgi:segregation and condensation protein B
VNAQQIVEAVLFASDAPLTADEIARADETLDEDKVEAVLQALRAEYDDAHRAFEVVELAEGYQILTRPEFATYLERFDNVPRPSRLSGPALETLAIIAYRQPLGRLEVEYIRGVGASGVIRTLQERRLIDVVGRAEALGRPLLYGTTQHFLEHFGFRSLEDLPRPEELPVVLRERIPLGIEEVGEDDALEDGTGHDGIDAGDGSEAVRDGAEVDAPRDGAGEAAVAVEAGTPAEGPEDPAADEPDVTDGPDPSRGGALG